MPPATPTAALVLPPPLANVKFPTQKIDYPSEWPQELHYPDQFTLVQVSSGIVPDGGTKGWAAKLRYNGTQKDAAELLSSFFTANGWDIAERNELASGSYTLLLEKNNKQNTGIVVIDPDPTNHDTTRVVATVFP
jgi:hypothetical protein